MLCTRSPSLHHSLRPHQVVHIHWRASGHVLSHQYKHSLRAAAAPEDAASRLRPVGPFLDLSNGELIALSPHKRAELWPTYEFTREEALERQLQALKCNNDPYVDHGIEILYRFADFDPFIRSTYFGRSLDLGQFERFRRQMHMPQYRPLLEHQRCTPLSSFEVSDRVWKQRLLVLSSEGEDEGVFEFTMTQRFGGRYDGFWFCASIISDDSS